MNQSLFVEPVIEKIGMEARLSDNADMWTQEVLQELFKQRPFVGQYDVIPVMKAVEDERGYGLGHFIVKNKTGRLNTDAGRQLASMAGVRVVKVPFVIKEQRLKELDVFIDSRGRPQPLTEKRLREALFRGDLFDAYAPRPSPVNLIGDQFVPPNRSERLTAGRGTVIEQGEVKTGAAKPLLLEALQSSMLQSDVDAMTNAMNGDQVLATALIEKHAALLSIIAGAQPLAPRDVADAVLSSVQPTVIQVSRVGDEYVLKTASHKFFNPQVIVTDRIKMASIVGEDMVGVADKTGIASISTDPVVKDDFSTDEAAKAIEEFGEYKVRDAADKELLGWVFPKIYAFDGTSLPIKIFSNGSVNAIQSDMAGIFVNKGSNIVSSGSPEGDGFWYLTTENGSALAFVPGTVQLTFEDEKGPGFRFITMLGEPCVLRIVPGLKKPTHVGGGEYGLPDNVRWFPLSGEAVELMETPEHFAKTAAVLTDPSAVVVISDGRLWSFSGEPLEKVADEHTSFLEADEAVFMACCLGLSTPYAMKKLAQAGQQGKVVLTGCRNVVPAMQMYKEAEERARAAYAEMPPKYLLLKEAVGLDDVTTVDKVLSLGFLTPENISTFIDYLPDLEEATQKLAYVLMAARIGLPDISEVSTKNAMERVDEVIEALRKLVYRKAQAA